MASFTIGVLFVEHFRFCDLDMRNSGHEVKP